MSLPIDLWVHILEVGQLNDRDAARVAGTCVALRDAVQRVKPGLPTGPRSYLNGMGCFQKEFDEDLRYWRASGQAGRSMLDGPYWSKRRRHEIFEDAKDALEHRELISLVHRWKTADTVLYEYVCAALGVEHPAAVRSVEKNRDHDEVAYERVIMDAIMLVVVTHWTLPVHKAPRSGWLRLLLFFCVCLITLVLIS